MGVLTMAGKGPRVLITPTNDLGKILQALHGTSQPNIVTCTFASIKHVNHEACETINN